MKISAFVGHSFLKKDEQVVAEITKFLTSLKSTIPEFSWDHAEAAEPKQVWAKVLEKIKDKNLFIGICTIKENAIEPEKLKRGFFWRSSLNAPESDFSAKTSDWIIQEIGLAKGIELARGTDFPVILLVENGMREIRGLQGDVEYIQFDRNNVSGAFQKLMEMITSLRPRLQAVDEQQVGQKPEEEPIGKSEDDSDLPREQWTVGRYGFEVFNAIWADDGEKVKNLTDSFLQSAIGKEQKNIIEFHGHRLFAYHHLEKKDVVPELIELVKQYPEDISLPRLLAVAYRDQGQEEKATKLFSDLSLKAEENSDKIDFTYQAASILTKQKHFDQADKVFSQLDALTDLSEVDQGRLLRVKAKIAKDKSNSIAFCALAEGALLRNSEDNDLRFDLAYQYSELGKNALAAKHYKILCRKAPNETHWNNLGVAYSRMDLEGLGNHAYEESKKLNGTLAISNLALNLMRSGFYDQAESMCRDVVGRKDCHKNVAHTLTRIEEKREREDKDEKANQEKAQIDVDFLTRASNAALSKPPQDGTYSFSKNDIVYSLIVNGSSVKAEYEFEKEGNTLGLLFAATRTPAKRRYKVSLNGTVFGKCVSFEETKKELDKASTSSLLSDDSPTKGLMIFSDDMASVDYFVLDKSSVRTDLKAN